MTDPTESSNEDASASGSPGGNGASNGGNETPGGIPRPAPYVKRDPNDIIRSGDWNEIQVRGREEVHAHTHTGGEQGPKLGGDAIEETADLNVRTLTVNGDQLLAELATVKVKDLRVSGNLEVEGEVIARDVQHYEGDVMLGNDEGDVVTVHGVLKSAHRSDALEVDDALHATGSLTVDGNVGIGTTSPTIAKLQVDVTPTSALLSTGIAQFYVRDAVTNGGIKFAINDASDIQRFGAPFRHGISAGGSESLALLTNNGVRMVIDTGGNVGIGTPEPSEKLSVAGNIDMTGSHRRLYMGGVGGTTFGIAYDSDYRDYGIFYTEGSPDVVSISPNGGLRNGVLNVYGDGKVGIGTTAPVVELHVEGDIKAANHFKLLSHNIISNSFMNQLSGNVPKGFTVGSYAAETSTIAIEAVSPFTKGFEGPYTETKQNAVADDPDQATGSSPYWYGRWYKGPRAARGGLADGWHGQADGHILKITGRRDVASGSYGNVYVKFPKESRILTAALLFKAWVKIVKGAVQIGTDQLTIPQITREKTEEAAQGWYQVNEVIGGSHISEINGEHAFIFKVMGQEGGNNGDFEVYLALPYLANIEQEASPHWSPSVLDVLAGYDIVKDLDTGNVGIGTPDPQQALHVNGDIRTEGSLTSKGGRVKRDFVTWSTGASGQDPVHIKTNIRRTTNIMYRILVEGYAYGSGLPINSEAVGYAYAETGDILSAFTKDYAEGAKISQYYSGDYVVIKLVVANTYYLGFSASAWFANPAGESFDISAEVFHQAGNL